MKGKIVVKGGALTPNGREAKLEVRRGERGTGEQVGDTVVYWPWSGPSEDKAWEIAEAIARRNGIELTPEWEE